MTDCISFPPLHSSIQSPRLGPINPLLLPHGPVPVKSFYESGCFSPSISSSSVFSPASDEPEVVRTVVQKREKEEELTRRMQEEEEALASDNDSDYVESTRVMTQVRIDELEMKKHENDLVGSQIFL